MLVSCDPASMIVATAAIVPTNQVAVVRIRSIPSLYGFAGGWDVGHQPYLNAIAEELNDRPRAVQDYLTPREAFQRLLIDESVATTP